MLRWFFCFLALNGYGGQFLEKHGQLLVVISEDWEKSHAVLRRYEKIDDAWIEEEKPISVSLGSSGLAWGIGLHPLMDKMGPKKMEGDKKSPAGVFPLGTVFGFLPSSSTRNLKMSYLPLNASIEAIDDSSSRYYNQIVDTKEVVIDWTSSEKMGKEPLYFWGAVIEHNFPNPQPMAGSAIFLHIWREEKAPTFGCTAMSEETLVKVLHWLDGAKHPVLVQLPASVYIQVKEDWNLP